MDLLLLEDDAGTARTLCRALAERGYRIAHAMTAPAALALVAEQRFDAAILDLMVPGGSGLDVLHALRAAAGATPVLILSARESLGDRVGGLEQGADDYLIKPFAFAELLARLRALLRRPARRVEPLRVGALEIDPLHRRVSVAQRPVELTRIEFDLVQILAERCGEVLTRRHLLALVWGYRFDPGTNVIEVHLGHIRRKLAAAGAGDPIRTVRGVGYVLDA